MMALPIPELSSEKVSNADLLKEVIKLCSGIALKFKEDRDPSRMFEEMRALVNVLRKMNSADLSKLAHFVRESKELAKQK